jgi:hypothetical protein
MQPLAPKSCKRPHSRIRKFTFSETRILRELQGSAPVQQRYPRNQGVGDLLHPPSPAPVQQRYPRNPAYLSMTMIYTGIASLANALWAILLLPVALQVVRRGVIERD